MLTCCAMLQVISWQATVTTRSQSKISRVAVGTRVAQSVSFFMNKFRELGLIDYNGGIEVHSSLLNLVLHDQPQIKT
jgi:hypothetical protein